ncbi:MAG: class I SAM-dependent methyltransferase, partial [Spartobacteria bacterium]|nr:class I SAM-dependent methyltransferase [Spartobacteria bacterium]
SLSPDKVYDRRFNDMETFRNAMWSVLCRDFFQRYIPEKACVIELAAGHCEFINHIQADRRMAVDINPDINRFANQDVETIQGSATDLAPIPDETADIVFVSNFFEHITKPDIVTCLQEAYRVLKPSGRILILQPNYRYCARDYWMFFDHITPIDDRALIEVLELIGFQITCSIPRFLPYSTQSKLPQSTNLIRWYLKMPFVWPLFGAQAFICGEKAGIPPANKRT